MRTYLTFLSLFGMGVGLSCAIWTGGAAAAQYDQAGTIPENEPPKTALMDAAWDGRDADVKALLNSGVDVNTGTVKQH
jgi:hypothetical protein